MHPDGLALGASVFALMTAGIAFRATRRVPSFYDGEIYGLTQAHHCTVMFASLAVGGLFIAGAFIAAFPTTVVLGAYTLAAILYLASFLRGAHEADE